MRKIIIIDKKMDFIDRVKNRLQLSDYMDIDIIGGLTSTADLDAVIESKKPDVVAVDAKIVPLQADWDYGNTVVVTYAKTQEDLDEIMDVGLPTYGVTSKTSELLDRLAGPIPVLRKEERPEAPDTVPAEGTAQADTSHQTEDLGRSSGPDIHDDASTLGGKTEKEADGSVPAMPDVHEPEAKRFCKHCGSLITPADAVFCPKCGKRSEISPEEAAANASSAGSFPRTGSTGWERPEKKTDIRGSQPVRIRQPEHKHDTTIITVYSGKGGVGKTTIATETAVYLSLMAHARGTYRVCIVDYNIDFGDVRSTLGLDTKHADIYDWAMDIKDRIDGGEDINDIAYTREEIEEYLQIMEGTGLYALCAPLMHDESLDVEMEHIAVMLRNLKEYGDFDFIVCDTGNNTRDSSVTALREADIILLVGTQDLNTAMCNTSAMEALEKFGDVDMSKICLVMNKCMSVKDTGISIQEVENTFPYPCIAHIPEERDVTRSNNTGVPVVYKAKHAVTKEIQAIAAYVTGNPAARAEKKKGGLKGRLRKLLDD